ncbi:MAG: ABC transporter [Rhodothalassiaceae bacterium]|nr:MAG: ABC transporter [Rhodothalassiaceae bacterium]
MAGSGRMDDPLITLEEVTLTLSSLAGPVPILRGISLHIKSGETVAILGPSGSGKSSLMAVMAGIEKASGGRVRVDGAELVTMDEDALARFRRRRIGIVLQAFHLIETMTALQNVEIALELAGYVTDAGGRARRALEAVGLGHRLDHYPVQLSGGEQQRVALARALAPGPKILFADEPTGNLDGETGRQVIDLVFALHAERGATLVLITHDPALANRCGRVLTMRDGRIVADERGGAA